MNGSEEKEDQTEPRPKRQQPREHNVTVLVDLDMLDLIDERRTARTPSGKPIREPRSTFIYDTLKNVLEPCSECGGEMKVIKICPKCDEPEENP
jgi:hypothetical protein